jgi:hypothetical protein
MTQAIAQYFMNRVEGKDEANDPIMVEAIKYLKTTSDSSIEIRDINNYRYIFKVVDDVISLNTDTEKHEQGKKLIVDRNKWRVGHVTLYRTRGYEHLGESILLNKEGLMNILGFYCTQIGNKKPTQIYDVATPKDVVNTNGIEGLIDSADKNNAFTKRAMKINHADIPNDVREQQMKMLFKEKSIEVEFVGEYR